MTSSHPETEIWIQLNLHVMRKLLRQMLNRDRRTLSTGETILWWERRRIPYNILVGCAGVISIASSVFTSLLTKSACGIPDSPLFAVVGIVLYGIAANILYSGGWVAEILLKRYIEPGLFAPTAFLAGLLFSVALTLSPAFFIPIACSIWGG